jgi:hypothetical protein
MRCARLFVVALLTVNLCVAQAMSAPRAKLRYPDEDRAAASSEDDDVASEADEDSESPLPSRAKFASYAKSDQESEPEDVRTTPSDRPSDVLESDSREPGSLLDSQPSKSTDRHPLYGSAMEVFGFSGDECGDDCCADDGCDTCRRTPWRWSGMYADFLWLQARNASVPFAVPQNGIGFAGSAPNGPVGSVVPVPRAGFRVGGAVMVGPAARITGSYTWYESHTGANQSATPGGVLNPLTMFPGTFNAGFTAESASAAHDLDFQLADANYEALFVNCDRRWIGLMAGAVYGQLQQDFWANYPFDPPNGTTSVETHVDFHGAGIQLGLEGEQRVWRDRGFCVYGRGMSRFLGGQFRSSYLQTNEFNGVEATTAIKDARIVPILDLELGVSWISPNARLRLYGGYMLNSWFNMVTTPAWIGSVQNTTFLPGSHAITFDGLVARAQIAF